MAVAPSGWAPVGLLQQVSLRAASLVVLYAIYIGVLVRIVSLLKRISTMLTSPGSKTGPREGNNGRASPDAQSRRRTAGRALGTAVTLLCVMMILVVLLGAWVGTLQQQWLAAAEEDLHAAHSGRWWRRRRELDEAVRHMRENALIVPPTVVLKHHAYPAILCSHHLGALLWSATVPLQLSLGLNRPRALRRHRLLGRVALLGTALLAVGTMLIIARGLHARHDFEAAFPGAVPAMDMRMFRWVDEYALPAALVWFVVTGFQAGAAARRRALQRHRAWAMRHVASGIFVAVQRMLIPLLSVGLRFGLGWEPSGRTHARIFYGSLVLGFALALGIAEWYLTLASFPLPMAPPPRSPSPSKAPPPAALGRRLKAHAS